MILRTGTVGRALLAATAVAVLAGTAPAAASARRPEPEVWMERVCRHLVDVQARALDARDGLWSVVHGPPPSDRGTRDATVGALRRALGRTRAALDRLDDRLATPPPAGRATTAVRDGLRAGYAMVAEAYADAVTGVRALTTVTRRRLPTATGKVLGRLDRATDRAAGPIARLEPTVRASPVGAAVTERAVCRAIGPGWTMLAAPDATTPPPSSLDPVTGPGAADATAPALLLPGRYRPTAEIAALAEQTSMTGRSRTFFYGARPVVETGASFLADCPTDDVEHVRILGCFHDGRIYVLAVTRPEVAAIVAVTAAHEMLHAVYEAATPDDRAAIDRLLGDFYATSTDPRLRDVVAGYDERAPENRATELHSLVPIQVATLTDALEEYYADYFHERAPVLAAYDGYMALFDGLIARYDALTEEIGALRTQIASLRAQSDAAAREAADLLRRVDALRAQGRIADSDALVPAVDDAARRARALNDEGNALVDAHNARIDERTAVVEEIGGLEGSLRPLG